MRLVDALTAQAAKKGCTPAQLSIAWVSALGEKIIPLPGSTCVVARFYGGSWLTRVAYSRKERTLENLLASDIEMTAADMAEIAKIMEENPVKGHRYFGEDPNMRLWG